MFADPIIRHEFGARPDDLQMIKVDGVSMEPLLSSGDRILIDVSRTVPVPPGIFVIWDGMGLIAKHVEHVPHSNPPMVGLKSLNPEYASYERSVEETHIVGRAISVSDAGTAAAAASRRARGLQRRPQDRRSPPTRPGTWNNETERTTAVWILGGRLTRHELQARTAGEPDHHLHRIGGFRVAPDVLGSPTPTRAETFSLRNPKP